MKSILIIQQKMIGDVLLTSILCEALKKRNPENTIDYLVYTNTIPVIKENPFIDTIVEFKNEYKKNRRSFINFLKSIRNKKYDLVIDAYGKTESNLITLCSGAPEKISYYKWYTNFIYTKTINRKPVVLTNAGNALENRLRLIFKEEEITDNIIAPKIFITDQERTDAKEYLKSQGLLENKPLVMISVLGSTIDKTLPFEYMATIIDEFVNLTQSNILFNYIPNQVKDAQLIYDLTSDSTKKNIYFDVFGKSLREFIGILSHCDMLIGNEGGAVNMAKALNLKTFTIFSPWIRKDAWNMFEDGIQHDSVHLMDFKPEVYTNKIPKDLKDRSIELYKEFSPDFIIPRLTDYLQTSK
ncbi:glycosyltransferase family 9 protein [Aquimarina addita]|uniref:Glycosyltransferase family 9 protein n=1 Tax=Aquimarina addita TaxID=870485 RepID=A0ABP6UJ92_9FLAO